MIILHEVACSNVTEAKRSKLWDHWKIFVGSLISRRRKELVEVHPAILFWKKKINSYLSWEKKHPLMHIVWPKKKKIIYVPNFFLFNVHANKFFEFKGEGEKLHMVAPSKLWLHSWLRLLILFVYDEK